MKILLATYQSVGLLKGGPKSQILGTKLALEALGTTVSLFDGWQDMRPGSVDLVHLFGANVGTYHLAREIGKLGFPMVVTPIWYSRHPAALVRIVLTTGRVLGGITPGFRTDYGILREICSWARLVAPNTQREANLLSRSLGIAPSRLRVIPNGVNARFAHGDPTLFQEKYGIRDFILNVGHVGPGRKNVLRLLQALEKINAQAVIIGRIEDNKYARACLQAAANNPRVLLLDAIPNEDELLASAYAACDVFVLPSTFETPGIAALEAALAGAKIVITKHGGTEEYFGAEAEYVEPTSPELIRHGITKALNREKTPALRERIQAEFLWESVGRKTLDLYAEALQGS